MQKIKIWYFASPLLFAAFNVLFLYSGNIDLVGITEIVRPLLIVLVGSLIIVLVLTILFKAKGPLLSTVSLSFIFLFGHMERLQKIWGTDLALLIFRQLWFTVFIIVFLLIAIKIRKINNLMKIITFVFTVMIGVTLANIIFFNIKSGKIEDEREIIVSKSDVSRLPDIYYIILDGYARGDSLKEIYGYDNTDFLNYLKKKGFYIPEKSVSNYCQTLLSMASVLNFTHIGRLSDINDGKNQNQAIQIKNRIPLIKMILQSKVQEIVKNYGYTTVCIDSDYAFANLANSDIFLQDRIKSSMTDFETILFNTTIFSYLNIIFNTITPSSEDRYVIHKNRILYSFEQLGKISEIKKPTFTVSHILCPHPPFIFKMNGETSKTEQQYPFSFVDGNDYRLERNVDSKEYQKRYRKQLAYLNELIKKAIDNILSTSHIPPIIILQADHGPGSEYNLRDYSKNKNIKERFTIMSAFHFPDGGDKVLYDNISSVNTFPVVFNYYFNSNFPFLEDRSYYSTWDNPYDFIEVTDKLK